MRLVDDPDLKRAATRIGRMRYTPAGNTMLLELATSMITVGKMGQDDDPDILNICLDTSRYIAETYGPESVEYEDMLYRLDKDLDEFLRFVEAQFADRSQLLITFTAAHGTSPSYNPPRQAAGRTVQRQADAGHYQRLSGSALRQRRLHNGVS